MAKQTFTTGQVLTAAQMTSLQQTAMGGGAATAKTASYVLVAADAGTTVAMNAAGATTITVNTGLFAAGDTVFIQNLGAGACTVTAGTATVATAGSLILPQNDAGILYFTSASAAIFYDYIQVGATSPLTTKGDLYTFGTSDTRLGVGANGTTLVADSSENTGLKWAAPAAGGSMTVIASGNLSGSSTTISSIPATYNNLQLIVKDFFTFDNATALIFRLNENSTSGSYTQYSISAESSSVTIQTTSRTFITTNLDATSDINTYAHLNLIDYTNSMNKYFEYGCSRTGTTNGGNRTGAGTFINTSAISSITISNENAVSVSGGSYILYGVK